MLTAETYLFKRNGRPVGNFKMPAMVIAGTELSEILDRCADPKRQMELLRERIDLHERVAATHKTQARILRLALVKMERRNVE